MAITIGDRLQAVVVSTKGGIILSRKSVRNAATQRELDNAFQAGFAVEGRVESAIKGGYEVRIARQRAFCPLSQIDIVRTADPAVHVGKTYAFRIIEYKDGGKSIVVSRRKQLEEEQQASADAVRKSIVPGAVLPGRVASVTGFGAFVDLGVHQDGLVHISELSHKYIQDAREAVKVGDIVKVKVIGVDQTMKRISLSMKALMPKPPRPPRRKKGKPQQQRPAAAAGAQAAAAESSGCPSPSAPGCSTTPARRATPSRAETR